MKSFKSLTKEMQPHIYLFLLILLFIKIDSAFSETIYINPSSNSIIENGTIANPFKSWSSVRWKAGNSYLQKRGTIYKGTIHISESGTEDSPIILGAYGEGPNPLIYGGKKIRKGWKYEGEGVWSISIPIGTGHAFWVDNKFVLTATSPQCLDGQWYRGPGPKIFFRPTKASPLEHDLEIGYLQTAISAFDQSFIEINNINVTKFNCSSDGYSAIYFEGRSEPIKGIKITKCNIYNCENKGITIDNAIEPEVSYCKVFDIGRCGIYFRKNTIKGIIHHNIVFSCGKQARSVGGDIGAIAIGSSGNCKGNIIEFNEIYDIGNSKINNKLDCAVASWGEDEQTATIYRYNYIHDNEVGGINTGNHGGGALVSNNLIVRNGGKNPNNKNGCIYISNASLDNDPVKIYNNTCIDNKAPIEQGGIWAYNAPSKLEIFNNILFDLPDAPLLMIPVKIQLIRSDNNCFCKQNDKIIRFKGNDYSAITFEKYVLETGQDKHSHLVASIFDDISDNYFVVHSDLCSNYGVNMIKLQEVFDLNATLSLKSSGIYIPDNIHIIK